MKNTLYSILFLSLIALVSCKKEFEEINTNPNAPIDAQPSILLRQVIYNYGEEMAYEGFVAGNLLSQHFTMVDFNLFDRHDLTAPQLGGNPWPVIYTNLRDNEILLTKARSAEVFKVYEGPALILKAYMAQALTDIYGNVPYFQAFNGKSGNTTPVYDSQESIYLNPGGIIDNLNQAIISINGYSGSQGLEGDLLFNGDLNAWIKLANSIKIKALMRISGKQDISAALQAIISSNEFIGLETDNATFDFNAGPPNNFRMAKLRSGDFNLFIMSETSEEMFNKYNDPRVSIFFKQISNNSSGAITFKGFLNGPDASQTSISIADYSLAGSVFRETTNFLDANFMTAWETNFLLAEAAQKGLVSGSAQNYYEIAVEQSFNYWGGFLQNSYLTTDSAAFGSYGQDPLEQILNQKWISNSINGYESWIEHRRTGFPSLKTISASLNGNLIPVRMPYPPDEQALNAENYNIAAAATNGNSVNAKTWWNQ